MHITLLKLRAVVPRPAQHHVFALVYEVLPDRRDRIPERLVGLYPFLIFVFPESGSVAECVLVEVIHPKLFEIEHLLRDRLGEIFFEALELLVYIPAYVQLSF